jgi:hypothetical protein
MWSCVDGRRGFCLQVPMVPIPKADELRLGGYAPAQRMQQAYYEPSLYGDSEKGVATMIAWGHGGAHVGVIGSWDNWQTRCGPLNVRKPWMSYQGQKFLIFAVDNPV